MQRRVFLETSILLAMLLLAILFAWLVARSMARSLRELRQGALSVAQFGLPHAVSRLRDPSLTGGLTPAQVADQVAEPLPVRSRDEFGQVTEAFNAVHLEAVRTAAEQAALRSSVATMFVNLARRSQILVDRLIGHLDRLERGEEDPDRLAELFQLDHLATRMRRNDENLLVLAGADSTRVQREPAALIDVLRAAQSEVEHYTRIEFGMIDRDIEVSAHAVNDMVHLVAELFDNATAFSPPNSTVLVEARRLGDGAVLSVEDRGIGISREQLRDLNERLANPPMVDVAVSRMMGLVVVARLANRHGVKVELRPADTERGTVADVGLPAAVLVISSAAGRLQSTGDGHAAVRRRPGADPGPPAVRRAAARAGERPRWLPDRPSVRPEPADAGRWHARHRQPFGAGLVRPDRRAVQRRLRLERDERRQRLPRPAQRRARSRRSRRARSRSAARRASAVGDGLPQRRNGENYRPDGDSGGFGTTMPRQLPANPETPGRNPFVPPVSAPPVPPVVVGAVLRPAVSAAARCRRPRSPERRCRRRRCPPRRTPRLRRPGRRSRPTADGAPHVPESLAAALDMTAEIPRYRPDRSPTGAQPRVERPAAPQSAPPAQTEAQRSAAAAAAAHEAAAAQAAEAQATAAAQIAAAQQAARQRQADNAQGQYADETMELPIFRELESAWFTTGQAGRHRAARHRGRRRRHLAGHHAAFLDRRTGPYGRSSATGGFTGVAKRRWLSGPRPGYGGCSLVERQRYEPLAHRRRRRLAGGSRRG